VQLRIERDALSDAVAWAVRSVPTRSSDPKLSHLTLNASDRGLEISGFDYETAALAAAEAAVSTPGSALVSGRLLADIARALPQRPVELTLNGSRLEVVCGRSRFALQTIGAEGVPALPEMPSLAGTIPGVTLAHAVSQVAFAAARDESITFLTAIRLEIEADRLTLAATDRYRLAVREIPWTPATPGLSLAAQVPARMLADTAKALAGVDVVSIALDGAGGQEALIGFEGDNRRTTSRLIPADYPDYRKLLPTESNSVAELDTAELIEAVKRVSLVAERNTAVRFSFTNDEVELRAGGSNDDSTASETIECTLQGDAIEIAFNPQYLLDGLASLGSPVSRLSFTQSNRPAVLSVGAQADAVDYRYLLMPVQLPR